MFIAYSVPLLLHCQPLVSTFAILIKIYQFKWEQVSSQSTHWILYYADGHFCCLLCRNGHLNIVQLLLELLSYGIAQAMQILMRELMFGH